MERNWRELNWRAVNWRAVWIGFAVALVVAVLGESTAAGELILPDGGGYVLAGLVGGFVAGYLAGGSVGTGAYTGGLASVVGGLVVLVALVILGALFSGLVASAALLALGVLLLAVYAISGAIGGVAGAVVRNRRAGRENASQSA